MSIIALSHDLFRVHDKTMTRAEIIKDCRKLISLYKLKYIVRDTISDSELANLYEIILAEASKCRFNKLCKSQVDDFACLTNFFEDNNKDKNDDNYGID